MHIVCPKPDHWHNVYQALKRHAQSHRCRPANPPTLLILAGWALTDDYTKMDRWAETVQWAENNECLHLLEHLKEEDFYITERLHKRVYVPWNEVPRPKQAPEDRAHSIEKLRANWNDICGLPLSESTSPVAFTGKKSRRLLVRYKEGTKAPWGGWNKLSRNEDERRVFTNLRAAVNKHIHPHEIDHIDFTL